MIAQAPNLALCTTKYATSWYLATKMSIQSECLFPSITPEGKYDITLIQWNLDYLDPFGHDKFKSVRISEIVRITEMLTFHLFQRDLVKRRHIYIKKTSKGLKEVV